MVLQYDVDLRALAESGLARRGATADLEPPGLLSGPSGTATAPATTHESRPEEDLP